MSTSTKALTVITAPFEFAGKTVSSIITTPGKTQKVIKLARKILSSIQVFHTVPQLDIPIKLLNGAVSLIDLFGLPEDAVSWKNYLITPVKSDRMRMDRVTAIVTKVQIANPTFSDDNEIEAYKKKINDWAEGSYYDKQEFINAFKDIVKQGGATDNELAPIEIELHEKWGELYKPYKITEVLLMGSGTVLNVLCTYSIVVDIIKVVNLAETIGNASKVFAFLINLPVKPFIGPVACVLLSIACVENTRKIVMGIYYNDKEQIWNSTWDLLGSTLSLAASATPLLFSGGNPVLYVVLDLTAAGVGVAVMFIKPAGPAIVKLIKDLMADENSGVQNIQKDDENYRGSKRRSVYVPETNEVIDTVEV